MGILKKYSAERACCCSLSRARLSVTPWTAARQASLSITNSRSLRKLMSIESAMPSNPLILYEKAFQATCFTPSHYFLLSVAWLLMMREEHKASQTE